MGHNDAPLQQQGEVYSPVGRGYGGVSLIWQQGGFGLRPYRFIFILFYFGGGGGALIADTRLRLPVVN